MQFESDGGGEPASIRRRALAFLADFCLVGFGAFVVARGRGESTLKSALTFVGLGVGGGLAYHVLLEGFSGRTVGKGAVGIRVVRTDGSNCTVRAAAVRTTMRFVDFLPACYLLGILSMLRSARNRRLGDAAAGTVVVETED